MSYPETAIDKIGFELHELAEQYAQKAEALASDPYFREAVIKVAVSNFSWSLYHAFSGAMDRWALDAEMITQSAAISRSVLASEGSPAGEQKPVLSSIDHVQLAMPNGEEDKARAFYRDLLGLPEQPKPTELAKRGGAWFETDKVKVHLGVEAPFTAARKAHIAFRVDDVRSLAGRARTAGYEVKDDEDLPGFERVYIYDPFGNRLEFMTPLEGVK